MFKTFKARPATRKTETLNDTEDLLEKTKYVKLDDAANIYSSLCSFIGETTTPYFMIRLEPGTDYQLPSTQIQESNKKMKKGTKPRSGDRLVFTYTNGATYTVRGIVSAEFNKSSMTINYHTKKINLDGSVKEEKVSRPVTNEISTVVFEHAIGLTHTLLDLRPKTEKVKEVQKPPRNKRTREEWEALEAQKAQEAAKQSRIAELRKELASLSN